MAKDGPEGMGMILDRKDVGISNGGVTKGVIPIINL